MKNTRGGVRLRRWLDDERRTQAWVGEQIGAHQTKVSRWCRGDVPSLEDAVALEGLTGIATTEWLEIADESAPALVDTEIEDASLHGRGAA